MPQELRALTEEQRKRLEKITLEEFDIRRRELSDKKLKAFDAWRVGDIKEMKNTPLFKKFIKASNELERLRGLFLSKGYYASRGDDLKDSFYLEHVTYTARNGRSCKQHARYMIESAKTKPEKDKFTRAQNQVLAKIWSMEMPFDECIRLINEKASELS